MNYVPVPNSVRLLLAAFAVLAIAMIISPTNQPASAQDAPAGARNMTLADALSEYAAKKEMTVIVDEVVLRLFNLGDLLFIGTEQDILKILPAALHVKGLALAEAGGTLRVAGTHEIKGFAPLVSDEELESAGPMDWVSHVVTFPGVEELAATSAVKGLTARGASVVPIHFVNQDSPRGVSALLVCERAECVRRIKQLASELSSRALAPKDVIAIEIPENVRGIEAVNVFRYVADIKGELFDEGKRFIAMSDPGTGDAKRETLQRLLAEMSKK